jgi:hypothetical protein
MVKKKREIAERFDQLLQVVVTQPVPSEKLAKEANIKAG